jgi:hypothetical protein
MQQRFIDLIRCQFSEEQKNPTLIRCQFSEEQKKPYEEQKNPKTIKPYSHQVCIPQVCIPPTGEIRRQPLSGISRIAPRSNLISI